MKEYILEEDKLIPKAKFKEYTDLMLKYDFAPYEISDVREFSEVYRWVLKLISNYPTFIPAYETAIIMAEQYDDNEAVLEALKLDWSEQCYELADKENIWNMELSWGVMENRPLIRGLIEVGSRLWQGGKEDAGQLLFKRLLKTNENDNAGIRYYILAIEQGMSLEEYESKFLHPEHEGYLDHNKLDRWFAKGKSKVKELSNY